jgi:hypothetical protein
MTATTIPIRFGQGQGLEASADLYGSGLRELDNAELDLADVIRKRDGATSVDLTRLDSVLGVVAIENPVGLWYRENELCVENGERLYARRTCATNDPATTGEFIDRGPWSRGTMREIVGPQETAAIRSAVRVETSDTLCSLEAWSVTGVGVKGRIRGAGIEDEFVVDANGDQVKGGMTAGDTQGLITWQTSVPADTIRYAAWIPGNAGVQATQSILTGVMAGDADKQYDVFCEPILSNGFAVWAAITGTNQVSVRARKSSTGGLTATLNIVPGLVSTARHGCSVWVDPLAIGPDVYNVWVAASFASGGVNRYIVARVAYDVAANTLTLSAGPTANTTAMTIAAIPIAVAASWQNSVTVAHIAFGSSTTVFRNMTLGVGDTSVRSLPSTAVVSGFRSLPAEDGRAFRNVLVLADLTDDVLASALFLIDPFVDGDGSMAGRTTGEVYARSWVAQCRTSLGNLVGLFSLVRSGESLIYADSGRKTANGAILEQMCISRWTLQDTPVRPAQVGNYVVQAFGGYTRLYDSLQICEQDWHVAPDFTLTGIAGGALTAGARYTVAVSWRWTDATGRQHDGEPTIGTIVLAAGQGTVRVTLNVLRWTERRGVVAVIWLSPANLSTLYFHTAPFCAIDQITTTVATFTTDLATVVNESNEQLARDAIGGAQASITDFCVYAGGRLWGPSSRRDNVIQHSTFPSEGVSPRWDVDGLVELDQRAQAILELEGRVVALSETVIASVEGDGPSNLGVGSYFVRNVPAPLGATHQQGAIVTPMGLLYQSSRGPRLLDRGFTVRNIGDRVARIYEIEGETVRAAAYDPQRGAAVLLNDTSQTALILQDETMRWGSEDHGACIDVTASARGEMAWLRATDVLVEATVPSYSPILSWLFASAGIVPTNLYAMRRMADYITGDAITLEGAATIEPTDGAPGIFGTRVLRTTNLQGEAVRATDTTIGNISTSLAGAAFVRLSSAVAGGVIGKQNGTSEGWNVLHDAATGFQVLVSNSAGVASVSSLTLASSVLDVWRVIVWLVDLVTGDVQIASDLEVGAATALPAGTLEALGIPLRIGDARLPPSTVRAIDGDNGGVVLWRPADPASLNVFALAQQLKTAWDTATGIPATREVLDGDVGVELGFSTPWLRPDDVTTHLGYRVVDAHFAGEYEGDHVLTCQLYADYDEDTPVATYRVSALQIALNRYNGLQYVYRVPVGGLHTYRAARLRFSDGAQETASFRGARLDVAIEPAGTQQLQRDDALDMAEVP